MSNELATRPTSGFDRISETIAAAEKLGKILCKSGMAGCQKDEEGILLALSCIFQRKDPLQLMREEHLMFGRVVMRADRMLSLFKSRPGNKWRWLKTGEDLVEASALVTTPTDEQEIVYTMADAKRGGYAEKRNKDGSRNIYDKDPGAMLRARLITKAVRIMDPEVIAGAGDEYEAAEAAPPPATLTLVPEPPAPETPKVWEATVETVPVVQPSPVAAAVAAEMKAREEQPLPPDIQPIEPSAPPPQQHHDGTPAQTPAPERAAQESHAITLDPWLEQFLTPYADKATPFFRSKSWIGADQSWANLKQNHITMLKSKATLFAKQLAAFEVKAS